MRMSLDSTMSRNATNKGHCRVCYFSTLKMIREDYAKKYLDLEQEARSLGWSNDDISGSVTEIQLEMNEAIGEWKASCGQEDEKEEQTLVAFAESIRFQFGPPQVSDLASISEKKPYYFSAGNPNKVRKLSLAKAHSRTLLRSRGRTLGKRCSTARVQHLALIR